MKVMKFGGSSIADHPQMIKVFDIIQNTKGKKIVILSACKSITDKLEQAATIAATKNKNPQKNTNENNIINEIHQHHIDIINATLNKYHTSATNNIQNLMTELNNIINGISFLHELTNATKDAVLAFGELLSTAVFHFICTEKGIDNTLLDARDLIFTDDNYTSAAPIIPLCRQNIIEIYEKTNTDLIITQGFIGSFFKN
jgi:aspartokinase/homoserine dehydrogenase 1